MWNKIIHEDYIMQYDIGWAKRYKQFIESRLSMSEEVRGWLTWALTRWADVTYLLNALPLEKESKILELGARMSAFGSFLTGIVNSVVISDNFQIGQNTEHVWPDYDGISNMGGLEKWEKRWKEISLCPAKLICKEIDMRNIPFPDETFDFVVLVSVIEHLQKNGKGHGEDLKALIEMKRVIKRNGLIGLTTDLSEKVIDTKSLHIYNEEAIVNLVNQAGLYFSPREYDYTAQGEIVGGACVILRKS